MQVEAAVVTTANLARCHVCGDVGGPMVGCQRCRAEVHPECYAMRKGTDQEWLCDACHDRIENLRCDLCLNEWKLLGGWQPVLTKISSSYIHMICAKMKYRRGRLPQNAKCTICSRGTGKLLGCQDASKCRELCHASCALVGGLIEGFSFKCRQHSSTGNLAAIQQQKVVESAKEPTPSIFDHDNLLDLKSDGIFADQEHKVESSIFGEPKDRKQLGEDENVVNIIFGDQKQKHADDSKHPGVNQIQHIEDSIFDQAAGLKQEANVDRQQPGAVARDDKSRGDIIDKSEAGGRPSQEEPSGVVREAKVNQTQDEGVEKSLSKMIGERPQLDEPKLHCERLLTDIVRRCCENTSDAPASKKPRNQL